MSEKIPFGYHEPNDSPGFLLWQISMTWMREVNQVLENLDLTHTQFVVLAVIGWLNMNQSEVTQMDVARKAQIDRMMTSKVIAALLHKLFVQKHIAPKDSRAFLVSLTPEGVKILSRAVKIVEDTDRLFFGKLENKEPEFSKMMKSLLEP
jgi:DNA-binding MarR family transcriptional regulator